MGRALNPKLEPKPLKTLNVFCLCLPGHRRAEEVLPGVEQGPGKNAHVPPIADWPSLCAANVGIWHRVLFTELLRQWDQTAAAMRRPKGSRAHATPQQARLPRLLLLLLLLSLQARRIERTVKGTWKQI